MLNYKSNVKKGKQYLSQSEQRIKDGNKFILGLSGLHSGKNVVPYKDLMGDNRRDMYSFRMFVLFNDDETNKGVEVNGKQYRIQVWNKKFDNLNAQSTSIKTTTNNSYDTTEIKESE